MKRNLFIGIDFAKKKFDAVAYRPKEDTTEQHCNPQHNQFTNDDEGIMELVDWIEDLMHEDESHSSVLVCGEDTGSYSQRLPDVLTGMGYDCWLVNSLAIKHGVGQLVRGKEDELDAFLIAEYAFRFQDRARIYQPMSDALKELKIHHSKRRSLVKDQTAKKNQLKEMQYCLNNNKKSKALKSYVTMLERQLEFLKEMIDECSKDMKKILKENKELKELYDNLTSIPGIGEVSAIMLIVITNAFTRFDNPRKLACYCGVAPHPNQSGSSVQKGSRRSRYADPYLASILLMCASAACTHNEKFKNYKARQMGKGKSYLAVMNNVKNKLLHIAFAIATKKEEYNPEYEPSKMLEQTKL